MIRIFILLSITLSSCGVLLQLTNEKSTITEVDSSTIKINGVLGKQMHRKLTKHLDDHPSINRISLDQIPGSINDEWNVKTCLMINERGISTHLTSNSIIASGGVDLFISGKSRSIDEGAQIGVHSWSDGRKDGAEYPRDSEEHDLFINFFNTIQIDTSFYWFTLRAAPGRDIHWMNSEEIKRFQLAN